MKPTSILDRIGYVLLAFLVVCAIMVGTTYHELQELEKDSKKSSTKSRENIESRLEEMMRKMEKDD